MLRRAFFVFACVLAAMTVNAVPAQAASVFQFRKIQYDSPGTDTRTNAQINKEYVVIKNTSGSAKSLKGYTVHDAQHHVYTFGTFTLAAGATVTLRTGKGTNTKWTRYWGSGNYVWNNTGDTAYLKTASNATADTCKWTKAGAGYKNC
ncbi:lamin tail domain-containing protein [soil metagenome]